MKDFKVGCWYRTSDGYDVKFITPIEKDGMYNVFRHEESQDYAAYYTDENGVNSGGHIVKQLTTKEYPFFPKLSEDGQKEAQEFLNKFRTEMSKICDDVLGDLYCHITPHIESDSWTNFCNEIMDGFKNYNNRKVQNKYDFKSIRQQIFKEYKEEIIKDLNQDLLDKIKRLEDEIKFLRQYAR